VTYDEMLEELKSAPNVTVRHRAVIEDFLRKNYGDCADHFTQAAADLIKAQNEAELVTFIKADLDGFIKDVTESAAMKAREAERA
jgi:hypothetical protein